MQIDSSQRDPRTWHRWGLALVAAALPVVLGLGGFREAAALFEVVERPGSPYFTAEAFVLLRLGLPLVALGAFVLLMAPGLLAVAALGSARSVADWLGQGFAVSLLAVSVGAALADALLAAPIRGGAFVALCLALSGMGVAATALRPGQSAATWALVTARPRFFASTAVVSWVLLAILAPKLHWETFNGDGAHTFLAAKLILFQPLPFWPQEAGAISGFPGMTTYLCLYPASWFIRLFGEFEASVRLPMFLAMPWLFAALVAVVEVARERILSDRALWGLWLGVATFALTLAFNATYDPYTSDIALPAAQDVLLMALWLFAVRFFLDGRLGWLAFYTALVCGVAANGLMMLAFWIVAAVLCLRPIPFRSLFGLVGAMLVMVVVSATAPGFLEALGQPAPGGEHGLGSLVRRFAFVQFTDLRRLLFVIVPCGIVPAVAFFAWRWMDGIGRAFTLFTLGYFAFFYFQGYVSLHYFVPVMVTPLVVFWRTEGPAAQGRLRPFAVAIGALIACALALPQHATLPVAARVVGASLEDRLGGYETMDPAAIRRADLLHTLLPSDWRPEVPNESYGGSPLAWYYYSWRADVAPAPEPAYVLDAAGRNPAAWPVVETDGVASLYLADPARLEIHKSLRPGTPAGGTIYDIPRPMMFLGQPVPEGPRVWSVIDVLEGFGIDTNPILEAFGVKRPRGEPSSSDNTQ